MAVAINCSPLIVPPLNSKALGHVGRGAGVEKGRDPRDAGPARGDEHCRGGRGVRDGDRDPRAVFVVARDVGHQALKGVRAVRAEVVFQTQI